MANLKGYLKDSNGDKIYPDDYDSGWIYPTLSHGWSNIANRNVAYRKIGNIVYWKGAMNSNSTPDFSTTIFTIQAGFRPAEDYSSVVCRLGNGIGFLFFNYKGAGNGAVAVENVSGSGGYECSFIGISYVAEA